jgi:hypothetical protein
MSDLNDLVDLLAKQAADKTGSPTSQQTKRMNNASDIMAAIQAGHDPTLARLMLSVKTTKPSST